MPTELKFKLFSFRFPDTCKQIPNLTFQKSAHTGLILGYSWELLCLLPHSVNPPVPTPPSFAPILPSVKVHFQMARGESPSLWVPMYLFSLYGVCMLSHFNHVQLFVTLWTVACHDPLSMGCSRQEYRSGLPCPPPGDLPDTGIKPTSLKSPALASRFLTTSATWEAPPCMAVLYISILVLYSSQSNELSSDRTEIHLSLTSSQMLVTTST